MHVLLGMKDHLSFLYSWWLLKLLWRLYFQKICQEGHFQICTPMLSFIHVDFAVHKVFKWLSQNKGNAFNIEAFDLFCVLIISLGFHYGVSLIPFFFLSF